MDTNKNDREIIKNALQSQSVEVVGSDEELGSSDVKNLSEHNDQYTKILKTYVDNFEKSSKSKLKQRKCLARISMFLLVAINICTIATIIGTLWIISCDSEKSIAVIPELLTALVSLTG